MKKLFTILLLTLLSFSVFSQNDEKEIKGKPFHYGFGITYIGNFPNLPLGMGILLLKQDKPYGAFIDFKTGWGDSYGADLSATMTASTARAFGDAFRGKTNNGGTMINVGMINSITKRRNVNVYYGIGYHLVENYEQYYDELKILSNTGNYYVGDGAELKLNLTGGFLFIVNPGFTFQVGYDLTPRNVNLGIGWVL